MLAGYQIIVDSNMTERVLYARSPARARRRAKLGHAQHHVVRPMRTALQMGDRLVMHPVMADVLRKSIENRASAPQEDSGRPTREPIAPVGSPAWRSVMLFGLFLQNPASAISHTAVN